MSEPLVDGGAAPGPVGPRRRTRFRDFLERHAWIALVAVVGVSVLGWLSIRNGTAGLPEGRPAVGGAVLVFLGVDREHRGDELWAWTGLGVLLLVVSGWVFAGVVAWRRRSRASEGSPGPAGRSKGRPA